VYANVERALVARFKAVMPPIYYEQRAQFANSLPLLAIFSAALAVILGGWLGMLTSVVGLLVNSPAAIVSLVLAPFFWLIFLPPILWAGSYVPLRNRQLGGWRLFTIATILGLAGSLISFSLIGIIFSAAILYFTLLCYDEFWR
jgi:hypothetical protein